ncbi:IS110 family transposase [Streptomyces stelliscabiei]|uniref:IS110 family transposase n=1 Tax=Streptomyces stelliscabiei TaxID=146820 RepID=UPI002FF372F2
MLFHHFADGRIRHLDVYYKAEGGSRCCPARSRSAPPSSCRRRRRTPRTQDETGRKLAAVQLPEGVEGITKLHELVALHGGEDMDPAKVVVGIETDRGAWVQALVASGYQGYAINPRQVARFKERYCTSGAKSDKGDVHALADMVRIGRDQLRPVAGDSEQAQAVKVVARAHQTLAWERRRTFQRLRSTLREYFPAALTAYADHALTSTDALELLIKAPTPATAVKLTRTQITAVLTRHRRRNRDAKAATIQTALRERQLGLPETVTAAYAAATTAHARLIIALNEQIAAMEVRRIESWRVPPLTPLSCTSVRSAWSSRCGPTTPPSGPR